jgi:hypothetical protein
MPSYRLRVSVFVDRRQAYQDRRNRDVEHLHNRQSAMDRQSLPPRLPTSLQLLLRDPTTVT